MKRARRAFILLFLLLQNLAPAFGASEVLQEVTVQDRDTLWGIANYYLKDPRKWPEILRHNKLPLTDPSVALPGMKLKIPVLLIKEHLRKAHLVKILNEVRYRKKDDSSWKKALENLELYNEDSLRTLERSEAHVKFYSGDILRLDENSLVILRPELKVEEVNLLSGALRSSRAKVITPTAEVTPKSEDTIYKTRIRNDQATIVQVERGSAEVFGIDTGKTVIVPAGFANITIPKRAPTVPVKVPKMADFQVAQFDDQGNFSAPEIETGYAKKEIPAPASNRIEIEPPKEYRPRFKEAPTLEAREETSAKGKKVKKWTAYRVVVAKDSQFAQILFDQKREMTGQRLVTDTRDYHLPDGKYYRKVSYFDDSGAETEFYPLPAVEIDTRPPKITIFSPEEGHQTREGLLSIEGQTEPGCFVLVNNYPVPIKPDGRFTWSAVLANEGPNKIKISVKDPAGNKSQMERTVYLSGGLRR